MDDVEALSTIVGILKKLDDDAQNRVLASVHAFVGKPTQSHRSSVDTGPSVPTDVPGPFSQDRTVSAKEFLRDKGPATDVERIACLAYYLTHYRNTPHFKTVDISALNIEAAQPKFSNTSVAVDNARAKGFLVPSTKGNKQISAAGEKYVDLLPDREAARNSMVAVRARPRPSKKTKAKR